MGFGIAWLILTRCSVDRFAENFASLCDGGLILACPQVQLDTAAFHRQIGGCAQGPNGLIVYRQCRRRLLWCNDRFREDFCL